MNTTMGWWLTCTNTRIAQVPGILLAPIFGWRQRESFATEPGETVRPDTNLRPA